MSQKIPYSMTEGPLGRQILRFSLPLMASNLLQVLFNMSDIAVVGRFAGAMALGSVGSTAILVSLFTGFLIGIGNGVNVTTARFYGAQNYRGVSGTVHTALLIALAFGLLLFGLGSLFARSLLELLNTKEELLSGAVLYLRIYFLGMPAVAVYNFGNAVLSAVGDTRRPLYYLLASGVLNVILNLFFVIVLDMSVAGVALASIIAQYVSALLILICLFRTPDAYGLSLSKLRYDAVKGKAILSLGIPAGFQHSIFSLANLFIQSGVNRFDAIMVSGNSAAANADALVYDVMAAFYTACSSFMSQNYGAGKKERVLRSYYISLAYSFGFGLALGLLLVCFGPQFLSLFTTEKAVVAAGMQRLRIMGLSYGFSAFMDATIAASRGLRKSLVPTILVILGSCVFRIIWVYTIFAHYRTVPSLYLLYIFSWTITAIAEILYFSRCYRNYSRHFMEEQKKMEAIF